MVADCNRPLTEFQFFKYFAIILRWKLVENIQMRTLKAVKCSMRTAVGHGLVDPKSQGNVIISFRYSSINLSTQNKLKLNLKYCEVNFPAHACAVNALIIRTFFHNRPSESILVIKAPLQILVALLVVKDTFNITS